MTGVPNHIRNVNARRQFQALVKLEKIARLYCEGKSQTAIAAEMQVTVDVVRKKLNECRNLWRESLQKSAEIIKAEQLAKVDQLEAEAWQGWLASRKPEVEIKVERGHKPKSYKKIRYPNGDPRFLQVISHAIDQRMRILGVFDEKNQGETETQLLEVVVSNRAQAAKMLPYMDFAKEVDANSVETIAIETPVVNSESKPVGLDEDENQT